MRQAVGGVRGKLYGTSSGRPGATRPYRGARAAGREQDRRLSMGAAGPLDRCTGGYVTCSGRALCSTVTVSLCAWNDSSQTDVAGFATDQGAACPVRRWARHTSMSGAGSVLLEPGSGGALSVR